MKHARLISLGRSQQLKPLSFFIELCTRCDSPHLAFPVIHIAGTNGKGSVSLKIAKALEFSGYKVGLYTSPHLFDLSERIQVNSVLISEEKLEAFTEKVLEESKKLNEEPTFFEAITFIAFEHFRNEKIDVAVLETGLGGTHDPTNICNTELSIITSISFDHMEVLGDTLDKIAESKAGIIKHNIPTVLGVKAQFSPFVKRAEALEAPLHKVMGSFLTYDQENSATARLSLELLNKKYQLNKEAIEKALSMRPSCRFEIRDQVVFDVAHNSDGVDRLIESLEYYFPMKKKIFLCGFSKDKDILSCLKKITDVAHRLVLTKTSSSKSADAPFLEHLIKELELGNVEIEEEIEVAMETLLSSYNPDHEILVVTGSFYVMQKAFSALQKFKLQPVC